MAFLAFQNYIGFSLLFKITVLKHEIFLHHAYEHDTKQTDGKYWKVKPQTLC